MLTRRAVIAVASGLFFIPTDLRRTAKAGTIPQTPVDFEVPRGACDAHVHVIGDPAAFPMSPQREYTPASATADELDRALKFLHLDRVVIVTPELYGADNSATLAAIEQLGRARARGIAFVNRAMSPRILDSLKEGGIDGIRLFLANPQGVFDPARAAMHLQNAIDIAQPRGWHLQISTPPDVIAALTTRLLASPVPIVLDYFGWVAGGVEQPGFEAILSLVKSERAYVKLAEPYRLSKKPPNYEDMAPVVGALLEANPDQLLWGSGWPNVAGSQPGRSKTDIIPNLPVDDGRLLNLFAQWVPDAEIRRKILVENPARLYKF